MIQDDYYDEEYNGVLYSLLLNENIKLSIDGKWNNEEETDKIMIDIVFKVTDNKDNQIIWYQIKKKALKSNQKKWILFQFGIGFQKEKFFISY